MGTSDFSVPALKCLISSKYDIIGVFTKKPKKANRGQKISFSPIYKVAEENNLNIFTPPTFKNGKNIDLLRELKGDLIVVASYGLILTKEVLDSVKYGAINIHPSLLPRWRGSAPIERALLSDDEETGVCIMKVEEGLDSGCIIKCERIKIDKNTEIEPLSNHLSQVGAKLLLEAINDIEKSGKIAGVEQNEELVSVAEKITIDDAIINWNIDSVWEIYKKIRTLGGSVGIFINHKGNKIKILKADFEQNNHDNTGKTATITNAKGFYIQCMDGILKPLIVQREGKKQMNIKDFLNGYKIEDEDKIN